MDRDPRFGIVSFPGVALVREARYGGGHRARRKGFRTADGRGAGPSAHHTRGKRSDRVAVGNTCIVESIVFEYVAVYATTKCKSCENQSIDFSVLGGLVS